MREAHSTTIAASQKPSVEWGEWQDLPGRVEGLGFTVYG